MLVWGKGYLANFELISWTVIIQLLVEMCWFFFSFVASIGGYNGLFYFEDGNFSIYYQGKMMSASRWIFFFQRSLTHILIEIHVLASELPDVGTSKCVFPFTCAFCSSPQDRAGLPSHFFVYHSAILYFLPSSLSLMNICQFCSPVLGQLHSLLKVHSMKLLCYQQPVLKQTIKNPILLCCLENQAQMQRDSRACAKGWTLTLWGSLASQLCLVVVPCKCA